MPNPSLRLPPSAATLIGSALYSTGTFREDAFLSSTSRGGRAGYTGYRWGDFAARRLRYAVLWGHYEGSAYRAIHAYSAKLKSDYDLYSYIRPIDNPTYRDVEFWAQHLMGGMLDPDAGDGSERSAAIPILTDNEAIRPAIAEVWRRSNWQAKKESWTRFGAAMGDAPLMVVDDPYRETVTLRPIHPDTLAWYDRDDYGNCRGYVIEEVREHPESTWVSGIPIVATYTEECVKVGESVQFTTYLDNDPYDWRDYPDGTPNSRRVGPTWTEPYGFVPLVLAQHRDMGLGWGMAELHPSLPKLHELDDLASKIDDAIRKAVDPRFFYSGVTSATSTLDFGSDDNEDDESTDGSSGRNSLDFLSAKDPAARATPLIANVDIAASSARLAMVLAGIERDHPELSADLAGQNASGKARRVAQERVEAIVSQRRTGYDDALVRAHKMAISIGGMKGYPGFEGFNENSYAAGDLDHAIGDRPVFTVDELDRIEELQARATVLQTLTSSGMPLDVAMESAGYTEDQIAAATAAKVKADAAAGQQQLRLAMGSAVGQNAGGLQ